MILRRLLVTCGVLLVAGCSGGSGTHAAAPSPTPTPSPAARPLSGYLGTIVGEIWFWRIVRTETGVAGTLFISGETSRTCGDYFARQYAVVGTGPDEGLTLRLTGEHGEGGTLTGSLIGDRLDVGGSITDGGPVSGIFRSAGFADYKAQDQAMTDKRLTDSC